MRIFTYILFFPLFFVFGQGIQDWETLSYMNDVKDVLYIDSQIWVATTGGAYSFNIADSSAEIYTNIDGLSSMDLSALTADKYGNIIFGASDGNISIYNQGSNYWRSERSLLGQTITDVFSNGDTLWVAANKGVGVFLYKNEEYEFRDFYDNLPINPETSSKIICFNKKIFYGTKNGLLYAPSDFVKFNLKSTENWKVYNTENILSNNDIRTLVEIKDTLYIGTANGANRLSKSGWYDNAFNWNRGAVNNIASIQDTLYFFRYDDYYIYNGTMWLWQYDYNKTISALVKDDNENLWFGLKESGIMNWKWFSSFKIDGPASNHIGIIKKDSQGNLWITSGKFKLYNHLGFYFYDFKSWQNYKFSNSWWTRKNATVYVYEDRDENIWLGSWGGGITVVSDTGISFYHIWPDPGKLTISTNEGDIEYSLQPISNSRTKCLSRARVSGDGADSYMVITHFIEDNTGNLWLSNYISDSLRFITVIPRDENGLQLDNCNEWIHFGSNIGMEFYEGQVSSMIFDDTGDLGRLWVGTYQNELLVIDFNETLTNTSDDQIFRIGTSDNLYSNTILCLAKDRDGVIWIGTDAGLNSYDGQNFYKHVGETGPIENKINQIVVDDFNNKWFATDGGISILEGDKSPWESSGWTHYTSENSGLPSDIVNSIYVDSKKGAAYIGTEAGLSIFRGSFAEIKIDYELLQGGPNPFILDNSNKVFTIKNLMLNSTVKILNINGKLVRILSEENGTVQGGRAHWDGRDSNNNPVASGIYIYMVYTEDGVVSKGKLSVIRK